MKLPTLTPAAVMLAALAVLPSGTASAHCLVTGSSATVVKAGESLVSPLAAVRDCSALRLVSGQAIAIWTGRDGKPGSGALRPDAAPVGYPGTTATTPAQRITQVLESLTTGGRGARAGYKRFDDGAEISDVHVPREGLVLPAMGAGSWTIVGVKSGRESLLARGQMGPGAGPTVPATLFDGHDALRIEMTAGERREKLVLRRLPPGEHADVDRAVAAARQLPDLDPAARAMATALVYESLGLSLNRDITLVP